MERRKVLIADASEDFPNALISAIQDKYDIRFSQNGKEALNLLSAFRPHLLVLDLMLPELDGLSLLQAAAASGSLPNVLVISRMFNPYTLNFLGQLDYCYAIRKPADLQAVQERIADLIMLPSSRTSAADPGSKILTLLHTLKFSPKHNGYAYLQKAIAEMSRNPGQSITKELYPTVASLCGCSGVQVERSIRTAISAAWNASDPQIWVQTFDLDPGIPLKRPTNAEFLVRSVEVLPRISV